MGKKQQSEDTRGLKAKAQKKVAADEKASVRKAAADAKADAAWSQGANLRAKSKQDAAHEREAAKAAAKAAKKAAMEADEAELANMRVKGKGKGKGKKNKKNDLSALEAYLSPAERAKLNAKATNKAPANTVEVDLLKPNLNRQRSEQAAAGVVEASGLDDALDALNMVTGGDGAADGTDRNATKRGKALYEAFEERMMEELKETNPGLKRSQYKDRIWKAWQKAPENPFRELNR